MSGAKIALIATGGTISTIDAGKGAVPHRRGVELLGQLGHRIASSSVRIIEFARIPGCEMTPERMAALSVLLSRELRRSDVAGAVVTHGTDTIEESAFFAWLSVASAKPVVFTGSMRTGSDLSWDGPRNLLDALTVARWSRARGLGAMLVMDEEIHSARFVTKQNGAALSAFGSPACGPIGRIYDGRPILFTAPALKRRVLKPKVETRVVTLTALSGDTVSLGRALSRPNVRGLVIGGFGSGRVPLSWVSRIKRAVENGTAVVLASRTGAGVVDDPYGYGGAHFLRSVGVIAAHEMPAHKARLKLMVALGNGLDGRRLKDFFERE